MISNIILKLKKCGNELTEVAAVDCLQNLAHFFGPSILRGRVEILQPK